MTTQTMKAKTKFISGPASTVKTGADGGWLFMARGSLLFFILAREARRRQRMTRSE